METRPFVSVIIPVYNDLKRLRTCLEALQHQTYPAEKFEVIVVDNGSQEAVEPVGQDYSQVSVTSETQPGSYAARNKGIALSQGTVLAFTDSDCIPDPDWIEQGVMELSQIANCGLVGGKIDYFFRDPENPTIYELYETVMYLNQKKYIEERSFAATANLFTFRHVIERVGQFNGELKSSGDNEWGKRVAAYGYALGYAEKARVAHPARHSFEQLRRKVIRLAGGFHDVNAKSSGVSVTFSSEHIMNLLPPLLTLIKVLRNPTFMPGQKWRIIRLGILLKGIELRERIRLKFHGQAVR